MTPIRIEVSPGGGIEIMRISAGEGATRFLEIDDEQKAYRIIRYLLRREVRAARSERFVSEFERDCREARRELLERKG